LNGDGDLDLTAANNFSNNGAVILGNGDGTLGAPVEVPMGERIISTDLGDLDGDNDLDWVLSSFGGGWWRIYTNDGSGNFTFKREIPGQSNPSCAVLYDSDNDGDLDMALTDEIADVVILMENTNNLVGIDDPPALQGPRLLQNAPNPFVSSTTIRFYLAQPGDARIEIFTVTGQRVAAQELPGLTAGWHQHRIDGHDDAGNPLPGGVYFYKVIAPGWTDVQSMVLVR
jgi:hypothetical protein